MFTVIRAAMVNVIVGASNVYGVARDALHTDRVVANLLERKNHAFAAVQLGAVNVVIGAGTGFGSKPNDSLPGGSVIEKMVGGLQTYGIYACLAAGVLGAALLGWGNVSHNPHQSSKGKVALIGAAVGLIFIGGINAIGQTFFDLGKEIKAS